MVTTWKRITTAGAVSFAALMVGGVAPAYAASAPAGSAAAPAAAVPVSSVPDTGVHLTAAQVAALRSAVKLNPQLTAAQATGVIGTQSVARSLAPHGHGSATGPCGTASLFGYSNGGYGLALFFNATVGPPVVGSVGISTNGIFASTDYYGVPPTSDSGTLSDTGAIADGTTANGWAVTSNAWYCGISVTAYW